MAHESFEDDAVAQVVNESVVAVKVDREERPDVDAVYMTATVAMTGQGGWPMTVFATPDGAPFFCGTYYPSQTFGRLVRAVSRAWRDQRDDIMSQSAAVVDAIGRASRRDVALSSDSVDAEMTGAGLTEAGLFEAGAVEAGLADAAAESLRRVYDPVYGGFGAPAADGHPDGGGPKFPPHMALLFLLRHYQRTQDAPSLEVVRHTCEAMARGGIYDQLAGGFARYSVDQRWLVPHFEKMLYDNALLLRVYTALWRTTADPLALRVATETVRFLVEGLRTPEGGLASSLDADTQGVEGLTYAWTPAQLVETLGEKAGRWAADLFGVTEAGTFEHGTSVLRLARDVDGAAPEIANRWRTVRAMLRDARERRPQPGRDDKVVAAWNALAVTALAELAMLVPAVTEAAALARSTAAVLAEVHIVGGRLRRVSRAGVVGEPAGVLEDYGCTAEAFCAMHQLTGEGRWLSLAGELLDVALAHFADGAGGFFDTADDAERLVARPADPTDNATPSGLSSMVAALTTYTALTGQTGYREAAQRALATVAPVIARHARFAGYAAAAAEAMVSGPYEIAIAVPSHAGTNRASADPAVAGSGSVDPAGAALAGVAHRLAPPGAVVVVGPPEAPGVPLLAGRWLLAAGATAYVCRGFVCDRPVTTVGELTALLTDAGGAAIRR